MSTATTFYFNEIFPTYDSWKIYVEQLDLVDYNKQMEASFDAYCYNILSRYFSNVNIRYREKNAFLCQLANVYTNKFKKYLQQKELIDSLYKLTIEDFQLIQKSLVNMASNPNSKPDNPLKPLDFISEQSYSQVESNRLRAYLEAINNIPTLKVDDFIKGNIKEKEEMHFIDLFVNVQPNNIYVYNRSELI